MSTNTKTLVGAFVGIIIIVLIVVLAERGHGTANPSATVNPSDTSTINNTPSGDTTEMENSTPNTNADSTSTTTTTTSTSTAAAAPTALQVTVLKQGTGPAAASGDTVTVNYTGSLTDGTVFDSNTDPKFGHVQPFSFTLGAGQVIQGWDQGVLGMKAGEEAKLVIPASLGYGAQGAGSAVPPNATLIFDVTVVSITPASN